MATKATIAIIGLGNIGQALASNLSKSGRTFLAADKTLEKSKKIAAAWATAQACEISSAVKNADIVILAIQFAAIAGFLKEHAHNLVGKIIIDPSNPIAPDANGGFKKIIGEKESAGEINAAYLPKNAKLAKALGTLGAASLTNAAFQTPERAVLFYATDDIGINKTVEQLIRDIGFEPYRVGGLNQSIRIEVFGDLHEFGALGKTITLNETKVKLNYTL